MQHDDKNAIHPPKRKYELVISISTNDREKMFSILQEIENDLRIGMIGGSSGGGFDHNEHSTHFYKTEEMTKERYEKQWDEFNKIRFGDKTFLCCECYNWSVLRNK